MALGDTYGGNTDSNKKEFKSPEVYSGFNTSNENGIDPSALSYSFWKGFLKIAIAPLLKNPTDKQKWDHKNAACVYLTHTHARVLKKMALSVLEGKMFNGGVIAQGTNLITLSDGKEVGAKGPCLIIRCVQQDGTISGTYVYEFNRDNYGIVNFKADSSDFDREFYENVEIDEFIEILDEFSEQMSKATAYTVIEEMKYDNSRLNTKIGLIAEALGVEFIGGRGKGGSKSNSSYFDSGNSDSSPSKRSSARQSTLDDIGGSMNPPE